MTQTLRADTLHCGIRVSPDERVRLYRRLASALCEAAFRLDVPREGAQGARRIALLRTFGKVRSVLEPPDLYTLVCQSIREVRSRASVQKTDPPLTGDADAPQGSRQSCSPRCMWVTVGRILRRLSAAELAVLELERDGLDKDEVLLVLGVTEDDFDVMRKRVKDALSALRCDHVKAAFPEEGDRRD